MKKILGLALTAALLLTAASCTKKKTPEKKATGTIQINQRSETVHGVYYVEVPADEESGTCLEMLILGPEGAPGAGEPEFYLSFEISEELCGRTIDLSRPLDAQGWLLPYLYIAARNGSERFTVDYDEDPIAEVVREGSLAITRNGNQFDIRISLERTDGNSLRIEWAGTATKLTAH